MRGRGDPKHSAFISRNALRISGLPSDGIDGFQLAGILEKAAHAVAWLVRY